jgi:hypothetical protein
MNHVTSIKTGVACALMALLAACGGGGSSSVVGGSGVGDAAAPVVVAPKFNNAAWSSPAVFVPAEQANVKLALGRCIVGEDEAIERAQLVIASNGDIRITKTSDDGAESSTLFELPFADNKLTGWAASGTAQSPTFYILGLTTDPEVNQLSKIFIATTGEGVITGGQERQVRLIAAEGNSDADNIQCESVEMPVVYANLGNARVAQNFGTAAGVTDYDESEDTAVGAVVGTMAFWENNTQFGEWSPEYDNLRFDLTTGELAARGAEGSPYTPVSLNLPQANAEGTTNGIYAEGTCRNSFIFGDALAKFILVSLSDEPNNKYLTIDAFAYGNKFAPNKSIAACLEDSNSR